MNKNRLIFFIFFALFHISAFIFTVVLDNNTSLLFDMVKFIPWFKYGTLLGLILIIVDVVWTWKIQKAQAKEREGLVKELNTLKAKLFDYQEAERTRK